MSTHALRAWEKRYGLLRPTRTAGGYRVYTSADERRVREVLALKANGVPAAEGAQRVLAAERAGTTRPSGPSRGPVPAAFRPLFAAAVDRFDEPVAQAALDDLFTSAGVEAAIEEGILPYLEDLGARWERGEASVAQEHFASHLITRRLSAFALAWGDGTGPVAVLAAPSGERHDLALLSFGVILGRHGWRVRYLGQDTPISDVLAVADAAQADAVVLAATQPEPFLTAAPEIMALGSRHTVRIAGRGATPSVCAATAAEPLVAGLVAATADLAAGMSGRP